MTEKETGKKHFHYGLTHSEHNLRRLWHISMFGAFSYYLVPENMISIGSFSLDKNFVLLGLYFIIAFFEVLRLNGKWTISLFREYEQDRVSAPFWFCTTAALLILLAPQWFAVPIITATTIGDPVLGELRLRKVRKYPVYGILVCLIPFIVFGYNPALALILAASATAAEVASGKVLNKNSILYKTGIFDDNFTMQVFPTIILVLVWFINNSLDLSLLPPASEVLLKALY